MSGSTTRLRASSPTARSSFPGTCRLGGEHIVAITGTPGHAARQARMAHRPSGVSTLLTRCAGCEANGQAFDAADERDAHRVEGHRVTDDFDVGEAREELPERDRDLAAREVRAEAEV